MRKCSLCHKISKPGTGPFFHVPSDEATRVEWSRLCNIQLRATDLICGDHFANEDIVRSGKRSLLLAKALPIPATTTVSKSNESLPDSGINTQPRPVSQVVQLPNIVWEIAPVVQPLRTELNMSVDSTICQPPYIDIVDCVNFDTPPAERGPAEKPYSEMKNCQTQTEPVSQVVQLPNIVWEIAPVVQPLRTELNMSVDSTICQPPYIDIVDCVNFDTPPAERGPAEKPYSEMKNCQTQTDLKVLEEGDLLDIYNLRKEVKRLRSENGELKLKLEEANTTLNNFRKIFTEGQMRRMVIPDRRVNWSWKDISNAICIHAAGPRAYHHLYDRGYPLPHVSTLQRWYRKANVSEGILAASITSMKHMSELCDDDKICVLAFDEMKVAETYEYDEPGDYVRKPSNYVQVVMARGLRKSWKQPIFYDYDCQMTSTIIFSIISALKNVGFPVVALVCDMGPTNRKLWKELKITIDKPWFSVPADENAKVFVFADAPHLLKLVRNHFLDTGLLWNAQLITSRTICDVLAYTNKISDLSIAYKISDEHLSVKGIGRQNVNLAAQLFSNTVANAIRRCYSSGFDLYKPLETADFIQLINDWFDVLNSSIKTFGYPGKEPFGTVIAKQLDVLDRVNRYMENPIIPGKKGLEPFQKGILISNKALVMLFEYVRNNSNVEYILTRRLNQDVLEHFFGAMRSKGGMNDHPTPKDFKYRLRKYILARDTECLRGTGNVSADSTTWLSNLESTTLPETSFELQTSQDIEEDGENNAAEVDPEVVDGLNKPSPDDCGILQEDALEYVSGYIIKKLNLKECCSTENNFTWVDQVSKGYLHKPSPAFLNDMKSLENIFSNVNALKIAHCRNLRKSLIERSSEVGLPEEVKRLFFKCRIYFRIRNLNKRLKIKKAKQRIMGYKKFIKINL